MARDFQINGESMVSVKSRSDSAIGSLTNLGLAADPIHVRPTFTHKDIDVDAWQGAPADVQAFLSEVTITMNLIHFDRAVLDTCLLLSMGNPTAIGQVARAGTRMGGGNARFAAGNNYIGLNISSPIMAKPWRFYYTYLAGNPMDFPLGTEKSIVQLTWRAIPYTVDPWGGGTGAAGAVIWDYVLDT